MATDTNAADVNPTPDAATVNAPDAPNSTPAPGTNVLPASLPTPAASPAKQPQSFMEGMASRVPSYHMEGDQMVADSAARAPSVKGVLGGVLMGALQGAARGAAAQPNEGAKGKGAAAGAGAAAAEKGAVEADARARAIAQKNFENKQQATEARAKQSYMNAQQMALTQKTEQEKLEFPEHMTAMHQQNENLRLAGVQAELSIAHTINEAKQVTDGLLAFMSSQGFDTTKITHATAAGEPGAEGGGSNMWKQLHPLAPQIGGGHATLIHTGGKGDDNGFAITTPQDLKNFKLTADYHYPVYTGIIDPKTGMPQKSNTEGVVRTKDADGKATGATMYDAYLAMTGGVEQLDRMQKQVAAGVQALHVRAEAQELGAKAENERAQAELTRRQASGGVAPAGWQVPADALTKGPQALAADIQKAGGTVPANLNDLYAIANFSGDLEKYPSSPRPKSGQMSRSDAAQAIRTYIDPKFNELEYPTMKKYMATYGDSKSGEGAVRDRTNTAVNHLGLLKQASDILAHDSGSHQLQLLNHIAEQYGVQTGHDPVIVYDAIANKAAGELAGAVKGGSGSATDQEIESARKGFGAQASPNQRDSFIRTQADLLGGVTDTINGHFKDTMHRTPEELGHHTLFGGNEDKLNQLRGRSTPQDGGQGGRTVVIGGQQIPLAADGTFQLNGKTYKDDGSGRGATEVVGGHK